MHLLLKQEGKAAACCVVCCAEHIAVSFSPWRIGNLQNNILKFVVTVEAIKDADGIKTITEVTEVGEQPYRPFRFYAGFFQYQVAD